MNRAKLLPKPHKVEAPVPRFNELVWNRGYLPACLDPSTWSWSQDKDASVVHVTFLEAPRHVGNLGLDSMAAAKIRTFLFLRNTLSLFWHCASRWSVASPTPLSLTYGADTGLSASTAPRRVPSPAPVHHPPFFSDPARWCRTTDALSSAARVARAYFQGISM